MTYKPNIPALKDRREAQGLSRFALSKKIGMGGSALYRIESGVSPTVHHLTARAIADALGCKVDDLFDVSGATHEDH